MTVWVFRDASDKMNAVISARLRLVQQLGHLAGALNITVAGSEGANGEQTEVTICQYIVRRDNVRCLQQTECGILRLRGHYEGRRGGRGCRG